MARQKLIIADSRKLDFLADSSVQLVVTSPPYWQLKDYGIREQIGFEQDYAIYCADLAKVWAECLRVLSPGCRLCVNVGDQFARAKLYGRYRVFPIHADVISAAVALGFDFLGSIIWRKLTNTHSTGGGVVMGSYPYPRNGIVRFDYEHILLFKKPGETAPPSKAARTKSALTPAEWKEFFSGHWAMTGARGAQHLAPFPQELPERLIRMFSFHGETVLDPFVGSGTTLAAANAHEREGIGVDIDPAAEALVRRKLLGTDATSLFESVDFVVEHHTVGRAATPEDGAFFGGVVRKADRGKTRFTGVRDRVAEVLGPNRFVTKAGRSVLLLGTAPKPGKQTAAMKRLEALLKGHALLLTDRRKKAFDEQDGAAYVHLDNRTFVNSRLIREGLLLPDSNDSAHPHAAKFVRDAAG
ncbi:MAG: site-specific DNA-methyltransferase [Planctomycetes bacterium]|nr:site-specific DNA-methyltransferase [Planctomycetota bacterium]